MSKLVTVIMPCYNDEKYVESAVKSVERQTYDNITLSVVDDASTDNSYKIIEDMITEVSQEWEDDESTVVIGKINKLPVVLTHFFENHKQSAARNKAIKLTWQFSDYYCQLDADDEYLPDKILKSVEIAEEDTHIGLVYSDVIIVNLMTGTKIREYRQPYDRKKLEANNIISNAPLIRRECFDKVGFYDESIILGEDWDMWLRITEYFTAIHIPEALQIYHVTPESYTFTHSTSEWNKYRNIVHQKMQKRLKRGC